MYYTGNNSIIISIIVIENLTYQKATNKYYGYIASDKSGKKCIILDRYIDNEKELKKLANYKKC